MKAKLTEGSVALGRLKLTIEENAWRNPQSLNFLEPINLEF
jgi:hypothetical protein